MSVSIYYTARRQRPLSPSERSTIKGLIAQHSVYDELEEFLSSGRGYNWEPFCVYNPADCEPGVVFEGATKVPDNSEDAVWRGIEHWCSLLTAIRRVVPEAEWDVSVDDHEIRWDEITEAYDPTV